MGRGTAGRDQSARASARMGGEGEQGNLVVYLINTPRSKEKKLGDSWASRSGSIEPSIPPRVSRHSITRSLRDHTQPPNYLATSATSRPRTQPCPPDYSDRRFLFAKDTEIVRAPVELFSL